MSRRPSSNSRRQHSREPNGDRQPAPPPRLPSLQSLAASRERDNTSPAFFRRVWNTPASRRAERIRNLENSTINEFRQLLDNTLDTATSATPGTQSRSRSRMDNGGHEADQDRLERTLDEANSHLRALLESTNHASLNYSSLASTLAPPRNSPPPHRPSDLSDDSRRSKRRKLDSERSRPKAAPFRYGKYGQVEPGQLKMEMVSCDGGMFSNEFAYAVENILKNDASVYCTKGNRCNIVLRHQGETPFTLKELVIKGPTSMNYSHPIREGMVFVAMQSDEILQRTAQFQIQYAAMPRITTSRHDDDEARPRRSFAIRRNEGGDTPRRPRIYRGDDDDYRIAQMPPEFSTSQPNVGVSTECSDEDDGEGESSRRYRRAPNRIGSLPFEDAYSDEDEEDEFNNRDHDDDGFNWPRPLRESTPGPPLEPWEFDWDSPDHPQESSRSSGKELLAPHARFFIEKKKSTCTIRFDPPISGRFVLLKMWNSHHDPTCNIDIQSVIATGYAGPRYFPSVELR